jgi:PAS domain S-box-containing protein
LEGRLRRLLNGSASLLTADSIRRACEAPTGGLVDVLLIDLDSASVDPDELGALGAQSARPFLIGVATAGEPRDELTRCDLTVAPDLPDAVLRATIEQGLRLRRLEREVTTLRRGRIRREGPAASSPVNGGANGTYLATALKELGKLLAAHFDIERVVDFFLDAITELVRPGRTALLLLDEDAKSYRVRGQRGLDPTLARHLVLATGEGLPAWFRQASRLAAREELEREPEWLDAARELVMLGGEVAVPLFVQAKLVGILTLGPRITGQAYGAEDLERLFTLASQVAMAVEDISLFNTVRAQHGFIEQVLTHLQSGAVTIDARGSITRVNRRAEEILGIPREDLLGHDLRALPSPLGDLLFDTVQGGTELRLREVQVPRRPGAPLEVSTSRILDPEGRPAGAVMVFDDPTPRHLLHRERQTSQTLELLNRVLLRLTDEIKNPLVSIYTFLELLPQRYDDPEFRETFLAVVGRDTQHLISLVDKLMILAGEREYKVDFCDVRELLNEALEDLAVRLERPRVASEGTFFLLQTPERGDHLTAMLYAPDADLVVKADRDQLTKALGYLLRFLVARVEPGGRVAIHAVADPDQAQTIRLTIVGKPAHLSPTERERLFSPLAIASERLHDVGPGVSQKIVEGHGGSLTLGGQEGEIRFQLTLPRMKQ